VTATLESIIHRARGGDQGAFEDLVRRFQDMAYGYAYAILGDFSLAEDATQEAFLEAYHKLSALRVSAAFPGWLRRIVLKYCDRLTRRKTLPSVPLDSLGDTLPSSAPDPARVAERHEEQDRAMEALRAMPERYRTATALYYMNGYTQREVAQFLEVPVTTVKSRLHDARKWLRERMVIVDETLLEKHALPEDFAKRMLMFPFPRRQPPVRMVDLPGERFEVRCLDAGSHFLPLSEGGRCDWAFYDWPEGRLTGVNECHVVSSVPWQEGTLLREWSRYTDLQKESAPEWKEQHIWVGEDAYRWVSVARSDRGEARLAPFHWADGQASEPYRTMLRVGLAWGEGETYEVTGVSRVTIEEHTWDCLKIAHLTAHDRSPDGTPTVLAEWYVSQAGRTVFFRRYNGPGWREPERSGSYEGLEGNLEIVYKGARFRHWYDCIPDHALW
jgi:RNA polymerase sigma factor (sigma-70 family)